MNNYYLGIDASKGYADFVILDSNKKEVEPNLQLDDTFDGHCKLHQLLGGFFHDHPGCTIYAAIESTGGYENNWFHFLMNSASVFNIKVARLNPFGVSKNSQAGFKRNRTDKISAKDVAEYLIAHPENASYQKSDPLAPLKSQWKYIDLLNKQKVQLLNVLEKNLYSANTETLTYCKYGVPGWLLKLALQFPTAKLLAQAAPEEIARIPYISFKKAQKLVENARNSIASISDSVTEDRIKKLIEDILDKEKNIKKQKELLEKNIKIIPRQIQLLKSFKGIGIYSAVGLLIQIGDVKNFATAKKLASFFGLHPVYKKSGDGSWGNHMSKKGRKVARQILYMVTLSAIRCNSLITEIYNNQLKKGRKKMVAIGMCMHKILRIIYGMLKNDKEFDLTIDQKNQLKQANNFQKINKDKNRRLQSHDSAAPISGRQAKKRKQEIKNQFETNIHNQIIPNFDLILN